MTPATSVAGPVLFLALALALALGAVLARLWPRPRPQPGTGGAEDSSRLLADAVVRLEAQIREFELQRQHSLGGLEHHLTSLSKETVALSQALRSPNTRGRWGELTLRRVAELAGMVPYCDFAEQETVSGKRPDMIVKLPGGRTLAVDAKAPLSAYLDAEAAAGRRLPPRRARPACAAAFAARVAVKRTRILERV